MSYKIMFFKSFSPKGKNSEQVLKPHDKDIKRKPSSQKCKICNTMSPELHLTPKCKNHLYCLKCMNTIISKDIKKCKNCFNFFRGNEKSVERKKCNLCNGSVKNHFEICQKHNYCDHCAEFLKTNSIKAYKRIHQCAICCGSIYTWAQIYSPDYFYFDSVENQKKIEKTIKNEKSKKSALNNKFLDPKMSSASQSEIKIGNELLCNRKSQSLSAEQIKPLAFNIPQLQTDEELTKRSDLYRTYIFVSSKCSLCENPDDITSFQCNHNICLNCLSASCFNEIQTFFSQVQDNPSLYKQKFWYHCPVCQVKISVPTLMILKRNNQDISLYLDYIPYFDGLPYFDDFA